MFFTANNAIVQNNLFDQTAIPDHSGVSGPYAGGYNAFITGYDRLQPTSGHDVILGSKPAFQSGPLGNYYLPSPSSLTNAGNTTADVVGLYEYTTQTSQLKETNSTVDIGFHYVAVDTDGNPDSTLWNGLPDYLADTDGSGELENWELVNYGHYGLDPNAHFLGDPDNPSNLSQFTIFPDPNVIDFTLIATNQLTGSNSVAAQLHITGGTPYYIAILVNNTNYFGASWQPYTGTNITIPLGTSNGDYYVWIGLRGRWTNTPQPWHTTLIRRLSNGPAITLTSPAPGTVSKPVIQLQGYVSENLTNFTYDLSNSITVISNQPVAITGQFANTNTYAITTNYFQAYDVILNAGTNTVTLHATDLAGNTATTNLTYILDYSGDTTAPVITVTYPLTNSLVAATSFTLLGHLDDDTATLTVSNHSGSQTATALVERGGTFSASNLSLPLATNHFTLFATDAAGNTSTQSLTVVKSALVLTVVPLTTDQLNQSPITITGTVSDSSQSVWVNGVAATVTGNAWSADVASPGSGNLQAMVQAGPNLSSLVGDLSLYVPMPPLVQITSFTLKETSSHGSDCPLLPLTESFSSFESAAWALNEGGVDISSSSASSFPTNWPDGKPWQFGSALSERSGGGCDSDNNIGSSYQFESRQVESKLQLVAPGPAQLGTYKLIHLTASATPNTLDSGDGTPVLGSQIQLFEKTLTATATNANVGEMFTSVPAGSTTDMPFAVVDPDGHALPLFTINVQTEEIDFSITTDANRDGQITMDGQDVTTPIAPWHFWINDSIESGDVASGADAQIPGQDFSIANYPSPHVNGRSDVVNYFPVALNLSNALQLAPLTNGYEYHLVQSDTALPLGFGFGAVKFIYTELTPANALDYLTNAGSFGYGKNLDEAITNADTIQVSNVPGTILDTNWLAGVQSSGGTGIILVEGSANATHPLWLEIWRSGKLLGATPLYLSISGVEQMFRHANFCYVTAGSNVVSSRSLAPNAPPTSNGKNLVFLHGYNVNEQQARGTESEMFRRFFWAGSKASYYGVTWNGSISQNILNFSSNLHTNEVSALQTAPVIAYFLNHSLSGDTTIMAHSLGNMVLLSAISDYGATPKRFFMIDAAVPVEAIDGNVTNEPAMIFSTWQNYSARLYASCWWQLFPTNDARSTLTWSNRFGNISSVDVYNFYSSGEEVLRKGTSDPPPAVVNAIIAELVELLDGLPLGTFSWVWQEKGKGSCLDENFLGSTHGGWSFNSSYYTNNDPAHEPPILTNVAALLSNSVLQTNAFFDFTTVFLGAVYTTSLPPFTNNLTLYGLSGSSYALTNRDRLLTDTIPALSLPVGANQVAALDQPGNTHNFDMSTTAIENGWPASRLSSSESTNWHHSDFSVVAYPFTHKLYDKMVVIGGLK